MNEAEFVDALDRFGADLSRWPDARAVSARALLASSGVARQRLDEALAVSRLLDDALPVDELSLPRFSATMLERIGRRSFIARCARRSGLLMSRVAEWMADGLTWPHAWRPAMVALLPLLLGFSLGAALPEDDAPDAEMVEVVSLYALSETTFEDYQDAQ